MGTEVCQRAPASVTGSAPRKGHQVASGVTGDQLGRWSYQKHGARRRLCYFSSISPPPTLPLAEKEAVRRGEERVKEEQRQKRPPALHLGMKTCSPAGRGGSSNWTGV